MGDFTFKLSIGSLTVGSIENASSVNIGKNYLKDFNSMSKSNSGVGRISGNHNQFPKSANTVKDPDEIDMCWEPAGRLPLEKPEPSHKTSSEGKERECKHEHQD